MMVCAWPGLWYVSEVQWHAAVIVVVHVLAVNVHQTIELSSNEQSMPHHGVL